MTRLRRALPAIATVWLVCQSAGLTGVPLAQWAMSEDLECTCAVGNHTMCPMHHKPARESRRCRLSSAPDVDTGMLASVLNGPALVPVVHILPVVSATEADRVTLSSNPADRRSPPDPPPPRI